jgi:hypothetical protein
MWSNVLMNNGTQTATITFSSSTLASAVCTSYTEPIDSGSLPWVNGYSYSIGTQNAVLSLGGIVSGNLITIHAGVFNTSLTTTTPTDNLGTSYSLINSTGTNFKIWAGIAPSSGGIVTTISSSVSNSQYGAVHQWAGVSNVVDVAVTRSVGTGFGTGSITTTNANDLIFCSSIVSYVGGFTGSPMLNPFGLLDAPQGGTTGTFDAALVSNTVGTYTGGWFGSGTGTTLCLTALKMNAPTFTPSTFVSNTSSSNGANFFPNGDLTPQTSGNMSVTVIAFASTSGDTFTSASGTLRASTVPTVTSVGCAIVDTRCEDYNVAMHNTARLNASRNWTTFSWEMPSGWLTYSETSQQTIQSSSITAAGFQDATQLPSGDISLVYTDFNPNPSGTVGQPYKVPPFEQAAGGASMYITAVQLGSGITGTAYSETIHANGGFPPYTYTILTGSLPPGLNLNPTTGIISGTPTSAGTYPFTIQATDSASNSASNSFSITVSTPTATGGSAVFISS